MSFEFEYPLSAEEKALLRALTCSDLEHTTSFTFTTKDGKDFEFEKSRLHGKWTEKAIQDCGHMDLQEAKCSECGRWLQTPYNYYFIDYEYCPNCGAKMEKGI